MKHVHKMMLLGLILVSFLTACSPITIQQAAVPYQISATGQGKVYLTPDVSYINIGVHSEEKDVSAALTANNAQSQAIASALQELGVEAKDIQTTAFNVYPKQNFGSQGEALDTKYVVENTVYVTIHDLPNLGKILDTVIRAGANSINGIEFDVLDKSKAMSQARQMAIDDAKKNAQELATASGIQLGKISNINVYTTNQPVSVYESKDRAMSTAAGQVPVSAGQLVLTVEANISYEIK